MLNTPYENDVKSRHSWNLWQFAKG